MKEIQLTQGYVALVDDEDYGRVAVAYDAAALRFFGKFALTNKRLEGEL